MSRCFPYRPPGYLRNGGHGETVIESIKLQKEKTIVILAPTSRKEKAITEHIKEKRREKKERRKVKKQNTEENFHIGHKSPQEEKKPFPKLRDEEAEHSDLTEEHGQPVLSQSHCYLSESAQSSNKRKRDDSASNGSKSRNIIRIRLPLRKPEEPARSGSADSFTQQKEFVCIPGPEQRISVNSKTGTIVGVIPEREPYGSNTERKEKSAHCNAESAIETKHQNEMQRLESLYKALIEDWVPPLQFEQIGFDDEEWLLGTRKQQVHGGKSFKAHPDGSCHGTSTLGPHAQHLSEANIYALPYTVPF